MIQTTIYRTESGQIQSFSLNGHALFANRGKDIVCAGVTAVSFGTVNAIEALTGIIPQIEKSKSGFLRCVIPTELSDDKQEKIQTLLEGMVVSLQTIERDYGKHMKITFKKQEVEQ